MYSWVTPKSFFGLFSSLRAERQFRAIEPRPPIFYIGSPTRSTHGGDGQYPENIASKESKKWFGCGLAVGFKIIRFEIPHKQNLYQSEEKNWKLVSQTSRSVWNRTWNLFWPKIDHYWPRWCCFRNKRNFEPSQIETLIFFKNVPYSQIIHILRIPSLLNFNYLN